MNLIFFPQIHYEFTIFFYYELTWYFANLLWINLVFREFTLNLVYFLRIHYEFTYYIFDSSRIHLVFHNFTMNSLSISRIYYKNTSCFANILFFLWIHYQCLFWKLTVNPLSISKIHFLFNEFTIYFANIL